MDLIYKTDYDLLDFVFEEGQTVEPMTYLPIIPTVLCKNNIGVAVGYSMHNQAYNPIDIIEACKDYMEWAMNNQGYDWSSTQLSPEALVTACEENNFNLAFTMAVANLESCFGCTPRSKKENSVFSVGAYDNGKNMCSYASQNESIVPFINLIKNDYLVGEKTIDDLLVPNQFVNHLGLRYAKGTKYEGQVKSIMNRIIRMYPILGQ